MGFADFDADAGFRNTDLEKELDNRIRRRQGGLDRREGMASPPPPRRGGGARGPLSRGEEGGSRRGEGEDYFRDDRSDGPPRRGERRKHEEAERSVRGKGWHAGEEPGGGSEEWHKGKERGRRGRGGVGEEEQGFSGKGAGPAGGGYWDDGEGVGRQNSGREAERGQKQQRYDGG